MSWDVISCRTIERVIRENPGADLKTLRKRISEAYPFGQRKYWPYKVWCREVKKALKLQEFKEKMGGHIPETMPLFAVALGDCPGGPLDRDGVEVEEAGKGLEMMRCFERGE